MNEYEDEFVNTRGPTFKDFENVTAEQYRTFLLFNANKHWINLSRRGNAAAEDMDTLRHVPKTLASDAPLANRFDAASGAVEGVGRGIASALLVVMQTEDCGVWNGTSEDGLKRLHLWPGAGRTDGQTYAHVNHVLKDTARKIGVSLWNLGWILYLVTTGDYIADQPPNSDLSHADELDGAFKRIAPGVRHRTETKRQIEVARTVEAISLEDGCDIDDLIRRLAEEQGYCCAITGIPSNRKDTILLHLSELIAAIVNMATEGFR
ncbi:hypothetical protein [Jannaschia sp. CCS1]|uniref:hypothetical protein n=1 Tax=Jannaschia sp. (strain CCS1) TaxID=290400 RepID=UPI000053CAAF|nr:hypothetical protein [Jannaschia sp. CCS1]ABD54205.1 hypothetical protein Jann_1288 [Jannaschia sp. CCS1]